MRFVIIVEILGPSSPPGYNFEYFNSLVEVADRVPELKRMDGVEALTIALVLEEIRWN